STSGASDSCESTFPIEKSPSQRIVVRLVKRVGRRQAGRLEHGRHRAVEARCGSKHRNVTTAEAILPVANGTERTRDEGLPTAYVRRSGIPQVRRATES